MSFALLALCGFLIGGAWSLRGQGRKGPALVLAFFALLAGVGGVLWAVDK
ncbi:MAG: hypothetical protein ACTHQ3_04880 [Motilibacteraceae bacterium]